MNMYIKNILLLSIFVSMQLCALTPMQRANIQQLIKNIDAGTIKGDDIITSIQKLNLPAGEDRTPLVQQLNGSAVNSLYNQQYPGINVSTQLVQDVRSKKITVVPTKSSVLAKPISSEKEGKKEVDEEPMQSQQATYPEEQARPTVPTGPLPEPTAQELNNPQLKEFIKKDYIPELAFTLYQEMGGTEKDPYKNQSASTIMKLVENQLESGKINIPVLRANSTFLMQEYYLLQLAKAYRTRIQDTQTTQDIEFINDILKRLLLLKSTSNKTGLLHIQQYEDRNLESIKREVMRKLPIVKPTPLPLTPVVAIPLTTMQPQPTVASQPAQPTLPKNVEDMVNMYVNTQYDSIDKLLAFIKANTKNKVGHNDHFKQMSENKNQIIQNLRKNEFMASEGSDDLSNAFQEKDQPMLINKIFSAYMSYKLAAFHLQKLNAQQELAELNDHLRKFLSIKLDSFPSIFTKQQQNLYVVEFLNEQVERGAQAQESATPVATQSSQPAVTQPAKIKPVDSPTGMKQFIESMLAQSIENTYSEYQRYNKRHEGSGPAPDLDLSKIKTTTEESAQNNFNEIFDQHLTRQPQDSSEHNIMVPEFFVLTMYAKQAGSSFKQTAVQRLSEFLGIVYDKKTVYQKIIEM